MFILRDILSRLQTAFPATVKGRERHLWFAYTLLAILVPFTASRTSNLLRSLHTLFGLAPGRRRFYTFMASPKLPWAALREILWRAIPQPLTEGRLLLALDDSINPKTGRKIFACQHLFDHAAKINQARYPWSQNLVTVGLLRRIHGRWCCLPLAWRFYFMKKTLAERRVRIGRRAVTFQSKFAQAVEMLAGIAEVFGEAPMLVVADSWFGNNGLLKPLRQALGERAHLLSRLRVNAALYAPFVPDQGQGGRRRGRPRKYGERLGACAELAGPMRVHAAAYTVPLYGKLRTVMAASRVCMLKTLKCPVRVVWVYRKTSSVALVTTDLSLSVAEIIEYYGARWKIEAGLKEIKQEIGSAQTQTRNPFAVTNHLHFCMTATTLVWIYAARLQQTPARRYVTHERREYAFADVRRSLAQEIGKPDFDIGCPIPLKPARNPLIATIMRLVA